jgi:hypothetical protein
MPTKERPMPRLVDLARRPSRKGWIIVETFHSGFRPGDQAQTVIQS